MMESLYYIKNLKIHKSVLQEAKKQDTMIGMSQRHLTNLKPWGS